MLGMLALVAMEPPVSFDADHVRDEKVKLLRCIRPLTEQSVNIDFVRGQYTAGEVDGKNVPGYRAGAEGRSCINYRDLCRREIVH